MTKTKAKQNNEEGIAFLKDKQITISAPLRQLGGKGTQVTLGISFPKYVVKYFKMRKGDVISLNVTNIAHTEKDE